MKNKQKLMLKIQTCWMTTFILFCDLIIAPVSSSANMTYTHQAKVEDIVYLSRTEDFIETKTTVDVKEEDEIQMEILNLTNPERIELKPSVFEDVPDTNNIKLNITRIDSRIVMPSEESQVSNIDYWASLSLEEQDSLLNINQYLKELLQQEKIFEEKQPV